MRIPYLVVFTIMLTLISAPLQAGQVGTIFVCYACANTGNSAIDTALANNPATSADGILFAFFNT